MQVPLHTAPSLLLHSVQLISTSFRVRITIGRGHPIALCTVVWDSQFFTKYVSRIVFNSTFFFLIVQLLKWCKHLSCAYICHIFERISYHFILVPLRLWNMAKFSLIWGFSPISNLWALFILFLTTTFLIDVYQLTFTKFLWLHVWSLWANRGDDSPLVGFPYGSRYVWFLFNFWWCLVSLLQIHLY